MTSEGLGLHGGYTENYLSAFGINMGLINKAIISVKKEEEEMIDKEKQTLKSNLEYYAETKVDENCRLNRNLHFTYEEKTFLNKFGVRAVREHIRTGFNPKTLETLRRLNNFEMNEYVDNLEGEFYKDFDGFLERYNNRKIKEDEEKKKKQILEKYSKEIQNASIDRLINLYLDSQDEFQLEEIKTVLTEKERLFGKNTDLDLEFILRGKFLSGFDGSSPESPSYFDKLRILIKKLNVPVYLCGVEQNWLEQNPNFQRFVSTLNNEEQKKTSPIEEQTCLSL